MCLISSLSVFKGEVLYRVRWKNYCSDDDTWEPEAHLEDCREVLLAFKKSIADAKAKKEAEAKKCVVSQSYYLVIKPTYIIHGIMSSGKKRHTNQIK